MLIANQRSRPVRVVSRTIRSNLLRPERLGQTLASLFWIISMLLYGVSSSGDWLQLFAASAWLLANIAAIVTREN